MNNCKIPDEYIEINEKLDKLNGKYYQIINDGLKIKHNCVSYGQKVPELLIFLRIKMMDFILCGVQYTLTDNEIQNNKYLKMVGLLFTKNNKTEYSLNMVNIKGTNNLEIHFTDYNYTGNNTSNNFQIISKIEKPIANDKIIDYLLNLLSHDKIKEIF